MPNSIQIEENFPLKDLTTFKVGGPARYFCRVRGEDQLKEALSWARKQRCPIFVLAAGSNVIISDQGFDGLVVLVDIKFLKMGERSVEAGAAVMMKELVDASIEAGLQGLEWAGGLPGTFGGAIRGNAGAFKGEIKDSIRQVKSIEISTGREIIRDNGLCEFGYRDSVFKHRKEVIVSAIVGLEEGSRQDLRTIADDHIRFRQNRHPLDFPNAGSVFKNTPLDKIPANWLSHFHDFIKTDPFPIVPSGKIIEDAGLKGCKIGGAEVSEKHSNYIINTGDATAQDIVNLIRHVQQVVRERFQIELETEQEILGFKD